MNLEIESTLTELIGINAPSKEEDEIADCVAGKLEGLGITVTRDLFGNVLGRLEGVGEPLLLNAHLDRVPPGRGHTPVIDGDLVSSDGKTNLGADDVAGITIILEALRVITSEKRKSPPLVVAFTRQEEIGLFGAKALDTAFLGVKRALVYDNAFAAGEVVSGGAGYVAINVEIQGRGAHPGKDIETGVSAIRVFHDADYDEGIVDGGLTRINIGKAEGGTARNAVPDAFHALCEIRSFLPPGNVKKTVIKFTHAFEVAAAKLGAEVKFVVNTLAIPYTINRKGSLLTAYRKVLDDRQASLTLRDTFVASDGNVLFREKGLEGFVVSTGVTGEHTFGEQVKLSDLERLTIDLIQLLDLLSKDKK